MGKIYNQARQNEKRKILRNNMTKAEEVLWQLLKGKQISGYKFRRQFSILSYVIDFYCPRLKLALEIDGVTHNTDEEKEYDQNRQQEIETLGVIFLRFKNEEVFSNLNVVVQRINDRVKELEEIRNLT